VNVIKAYIWFVAATFVAYGVMFVFWPVGSFATIFGAEPGTAAGLVEVKATCGGMAIALGAVLVMTSLREETMLLGAKMIFAIMMIVAVLRAYGMLTAGGASSLVIGYFIFELMVAALAIVLHSKYSQKSNYNSMNKSDSMMTAK